MSADIQVRTKWFFGVFVLFIFIMVIVGHWKTKINKEKPSGSIAQKKEQKLTQLLTETESETQEKSNGSSSQRKIITMNGYDPDSRETIDPISVWKNYDTRTFAGLVRHGEKVYFIERKGEGVLIETKTGLTGWVTYLFIKEFEQ